MSNDKLANFAAWCKRIVLALPLAVALALTVVDACLIDRLGLNRQHISGFVFLFAMPCAWLIDHGWLWVRHPQWLEATMGYVLLLWIPALLYSTCLWIAIRGFTFVSRRR